MAKKAHFRDNMLFLDRAVLYFQWKKMLISAKAHSRKKVWCVAIKILLGVLLLAVVLCLGLWLKKVWTLMHERKKTVELAAQQVNILRAMAEKVDEGPLKRSESIYLQAVDLYMKDYNKPENHIPAMVFGFHPIAKTDLLTQEGKRC